MLKCKKEVYYTQPTLRYIAGYSVSGLTAVEEQSSAAPLTYAVAP